MGVGCGLKENKEIQEEKPVKQKGNLDEETKHKVFMWYGPAFPSPCGGINAHSWGCLRVPPLFRGAQHT